MSGNSLSSWLSKFFNKCMAKGEFRNLLKTAQITPIPKLLLNLLLMIDQNPAFQPSPKF